ncbi:hypothetical protein J6X13_02750 [Candidatus Saccharibacteria bacterium]|nr:hypothetical protein [Candidatus Saccharibacteria bacterium]
MIGSFTQLYEDNFDLPVEERRMLMRGSEKDKFDRAIVGIRPGDKFIVKMNDSCTYLFLTTKETFEVFPKQEFFGVCMIEERECGFIPYEIYMYGNAILLQDDDDEPFAVHDKDGAWIDYPSTFNTFDVRQRLKKTAGYKYSYEAQNVDNHKLKKAPWFICDGYTYRQPKLGCYEYLGAKTIELGEFLEDIRKKLHREMKYDENSKCLCL